MGPTRENWTLFANFSRRKNIYGNLLKRRKAFQRTLTLGHLAINLQELGGGEEVDHSPLTEDLPLCGGRMRRKCPYIGSSIEQLDISVDSASLRGDILEEFLLPLGVVT